MTLQTIIVDTWHSLSGGRPQPSMALGLNIAVAVALTFVFAGQAIAQDTRAGVIENAQADRQRVLTPPRPNRAERIITRLQDWGLFAGAPRGLYPWIGSAYPGSGLTFGAGFRQVFADDGAVNTMGAYSASQSSRAEVEVALPSFARRRARVTLYGQYIDAPEVKFFGIGNTSQRGDLTYFGFKPRRGGARIDFDAAKKLSLGGGVSYLATDTTGLQNLSIDYLNSSVRALLDRRGRLGYSGRGGAYRLQFDDYRQRSESGRSFRSLEAEVQQLVPIMRANWVIALRGLATVTDAETNGEVPFFMLPSLGGGKTLRGYEDFRFRDRHRMLMSAELRWTPARFLDMALFYDTGKVTPRREDLDFENLNDSYGIGARIVSAKGYVFGIEVARSREHAARLLVKAGGGF